MSRQTVHSSSNPGSSGVTPDQEVGDSGSTPLTITTAILALTRDGAACDLLMEVAIHRGYGLCCATDGAEAIRILNSEPPALVIADIDTPDGRALVRALRAEEKWRGIPLFALTATNNPMAAVTIDAPVFFKPDLGGLEEAVVGRFESGEQQNPILDNTWLGRTPSA